MADFYDRESEGDQLKIIFQGEPNLIHFVYGPMNSGKTSLLVRILNSLPPDMVPFYINFRGRDVSTTGEFLNCLFTIDKKSAMDTAREYLRYLSGEGAGALAKLTGIPIPKRLFDLIFKEKDKGDDAFAYLEEFFNGLLESGQRPVLVLDELQMIKKVANAAGGPLIDKLFNFMVRMTKETHFCHCLAVTSDSLFVEQISGNARLEGRSRYFLVDDLARDRAFGVYDKFGFKDKELVWKFIGGKIGDMVRLGAELRLGLSEKDSLDRLVKETANRLEDLLEEAREGFIRVKHRDKSITMAEDRIRETLALFISNSTVAKGDIPPIYRKFLVEENLLFLDPVRGIVYPQGQLVRAAIKDLI
jgi:AAA+ ATPase superfamily predicted ATPase